MIQKARFTWISMPRVYTRLRASGFFSAGGRRAPPLQAPGRMPATVALVLACLVGVRPTLAFACPDCAVGRRARTFIREDPNTWAHLALLLLPFLVVWLVALWFHHRGRNAGIGKDG